MNRVVLFAPFLLVGCADPVKDAQAERDVVLRSNPTSQQVCEAERKVASAMLKAKDAGYEIQQSTASIACLHAQTNSAPLSAPLVTENFQTAP